ncbi:MAG: hypothetical protein JNM43_09680 [Planctomycetaceae bacterium]|nr:hypothetical protein [Planctomycetaceae bacterium]
MSRTGPKRLITVLITIVLLAVILIPTARWYSERQRLTELKTLKDDCKSCVRDEDWESLRSAAERWSELEPTDANAWLNLADALQKLGEPQKSVEALLKVPKTDRKVRPAYLLASEMQMREARQPLQGIATLETLRDIDPDAEIVRRQLISLYALTLQRQKMIREIYSAFQYRAEPKEAYVYLMLSDHLSFTNGFQLNTQWLSAAPDSELFAVARLVQLSDTLQRLEKQDEDTEEQKKSVQEQMASLRQKYSKNRALLVTELERLVLEQNIDAVGELLNDSTDDSDDSLMMRYRGWHCLMTEDYAKAEGHYRASIKLMPLDWRTWHELADVLRNLKRLDEAENAAKIAVMGKELRKICLSLPDASQAPEELLLQILNYATACGAKEVEEILRFRFGQ